MNSKLALSNQSADVIQEFRELAIKVDKASPGKDDVRALNVFLNQHPEFWRVSGDLARQGTLIMIEGMSAPQVMKESLKVGLSHMTTQLTQPGDGELEKLIIRQIVGCWLRLYHIESTYSQYLVENKLTPAQGDFWERRLSAAQRRYLRAIESLARVRRMNLPAVQVNIGAQQVNQVNTSS